MDAVLGGRFCCWRGLNAAVGVVGEFGFGFGLGDPSGAGPGRNRDWVGEGGADRPFSVCPLVLPLLAPAGEVNVSKRIRHPVNCMILLILPFFFPEMNSRCSLANSSWKRIS